MSLFEILFERRNPGNVGHVEKTDPFESEVSKGVLIAETIFTLAFIGIILAAMLSNTTSIEGFVSISFLVVMYLVLAYNVNPQPDYENMGMFGGIFDNPFRYSDDINRFLLGLKVVLLPGRIATTTIAHWIYIIRR